VRKYHRVTAHSAKGSGWAIDTTGHQLPGPGNDFLAMRALHDLDREEMAKTKKPAAR
tara:strand:+ start:135 stop:305 length:171 start_codon:yes stop_codon:yes gene_type:complete